VVRKIYDLMPEPKWVISMGACASSGGMFRSYPVVQGIDLFLPVDVFVACCPTRPENLLHALMDLQKKIQGEASMGRGRGLPIYIPENPEPAIKAQPA
jgi:NADH-quinone oxidoreductase subunit B